MGLRVNILSAVTLSLQSTERVLRHFNFLGFGVGPQRFRFFGGVCRAAPDPCLKVQALGFGAGLGFRV